MTDFRICSLSVIRCCLLGVMLLAQSGASGSFARADEGLDFFEKEVRPLLIKRCYSCHSGVKTSGGLALDTRRGWADGGDSGPAIVPGKPDDSLLIEAIHYRGGLEMPPPKQGGRLSEAEIAVLTRWVERGAPDPREEIAKLGGMSAEQARSWWAFQPLPELPAGGVTPDLIDRMIAEGMKQRGLTRQGSQQADRRTLLRRVTYDLIGLPPTPEAVSAFERETDPAAFSRIIDQLLESPQYGPHWGRHWLDVVRYADTAGENTDRPLPHAWRYRNWVCDSLQRDLPFDEFVRLQIAGDLLGKDRPDTERRAGIIATGYLAIARRFGHDIDKDIHLTHEDVIDNLGKNFLGLTLGCARCHDHKYDAVTAHDYYALYGIFDSTKFSFPGCEPQGQPRDLRPLLTSEEIEQRMRPWRERTAAREAEIKRREQLASRAEMKQLAISATQTLLEGKVGEGASVPLVGPNESPLRTELQAGEVLQLVVLPNDNHGADSTLVEWTIEATSAAPNASPARWSLADCIPRLLTGNPVDAGQQTTWSFLNVTDGPVFLADQKTVIDGHADLNAWATGDLPSVFVNKSAEPISVWTKLPGQTFFVHPGPKNPVAISWTAPTTGEYFITGRVADAHPAGLDGVSFQLQRITNLKYSQMLAAAGQLRAVPLPDPGPEPVLPVAYAVTEAEPHHTRLHLRGDPEQLGDPVPRRWLEIFGGEAIPPEAGSGRLQLAEWVARHPLTARVIVNRVWQWHFGQGLVRSPNDFGARGELPTHPELLDLLAAQFVAGGYQLKPLHRLILQTEAYQRNSLQSVHVSSQDPENRTLARFNRRRLSAEELRDSLLFVAGQLDLTPGEAHPFPPEKTWTFTQHNPFNAEYDTNRRSVYLMVQRQRRHPFLGLFDGADPNASTPARQTTVVPSQALYFLNDPFFHTQADRLAERILAVNPSETEGEEPRVRFAYQLVLQREPAPEELKRAQEFLRDDSTSKQDLWRSLCRVLLASNEFLHLD